MSTLHYSSSVKTYHFYPGNPDRSIKELQDTDQTPLHTVKIVHHPETKAEHLHINDHKIHPDNFEYDKHMNVLKWHEGEGETVKRGHIQFSANHMIGRGFIQNSPETAGVLAAKKELVLDFSKIQLTNTTTFQYKNLVSYHNDSLKFNESFFNEEVQNALRTSKHANSIAFLSDGYASTDWWTKDSEIKWALKITDNNHKKTINFWSDYESHPAPPYTYNSHEVTLPDGTSAVVIDFVFTETEEELEQLYMKTFMATPAIKALDDAVKKILEKSEQANFQKKMKNGTFLFPRKLRLYCSRSFEKVYFGAGIFSPLSDDKKAIYLLSCDDGKMTTVDDHTTPGDHQVPKVQTKKYNIRSLIDSSRTSDPTAPNTDVVQKNALEDFQNLVRFNMDQWVLKTFNLTRPSTMSDEVMKIAGIVAPFNDRQDHFKAYDTYDEYHQAVNPKAGQYPGEEITNTMKWYKQLQVPYLTQSLGEEVDKIKDTNSKKYAQQLDANKAATYLQYGMLHEEKEDIKKYGTSYNRQINALYRHHYLQVNPNVKVYIDEQRNPARFEEFYGLVNNHYADGEVARMVEIWKSHIINNSPLLKTYEFKKELNYLTASQPAEYITSGVQDSKDEMLQDMIDHLQLIDTLATHAIDRKCFWAFRLIFYLTGPEGGDHVLKPLDIGGLSWNGTFKQVMHLLDVLTMYDNQVDTKYSQYFLETLVTQSLISRQLFNLDYSHFIGNASQEAYEIIQLFLQRQALSEDQDLATLASNLASELSKQHYLKKGKVFVLAMKSSSVGIKASVLMSKLFANSPKLKKALSKLGPIGPLAFAVSMGLAGNSMFKKAGEWHPTALAKMLIFSADMLGRSSLAALRLGVNARYAIKYGASIGSKWTNFKAVTGFSKEAELKLVTHIQERAGMFVKLLGGTNEAFDAKYSKGALTELEEKMKSFDVDSLNELKQKNPFAVTPADEEMFTGAGTRQRIATTRMYRKVRMGVKAAWGGLLTAANLALSIYSLIEDIVDKKGAWQITSGALLVASALIEFALVFVNLAIDAEVAIAAVLTTVASIGSIVAPALLVAGIIILIIALVQEKPKGPLQLFAENYAPNGPNGVSYIKESIFSPYSFNISSIDYGQRTQIASCTYRSKKWESTSPILKMTATGVELSSKQNNDASTCLWVDMQIDDTARIYTSDPAKGLKYLLRFNSKQNKLSSRMDELDPNEIKHTADTIINEQSWIIDGVKDVKSEELSPVTNANYKSSPTNQTITTIGPVGLFTIKNKHKDQYLVKTSANALTIEAVADLEERLEQIKKGNTTVNNPFWFFSQAFVKPNHISYQTYNVLGFDLENNKHLPDALQGRDLRWSMITNLGKQSIFEIDEYSGAIRFKAGKIPTDLEIPYETAKVTARVHYNTKLTTSIDNVILQTSVDRVPKVYYEDTNGHQLINQLPLAIPKDEVAEQTAEYLAVEPQYKEAYTAVRNQFKGNASALKKLDLHYRLWSPLDQQKAGFLEFNEKMGVFSQTRAATQDYGSPIVPVMVTNDYGAEIIDIVIEPAFSIDYLVGGQTPYVHNIAKGKIMKPTLSPAPPAEWTQEWSIEVVMDGEGHSKEISLPAFIQFDPANGNLSIDESKATDQELASMSTYKCQVSLLMKKGKLRVGVPVTTYLLLQSEKAVTDSEFTIDGYSPYHSHKVVQKLELSNLLGYYKPAKEWDDVNFQLSSFSDEIHCLFIEGLPDFMSVKNDGTLKFTEGFQPNDFEAGLYTITGYYTDGQIILKRSFQLDCKKDLPLPKI